MALRDVKKYYSNVVGQYVSLKNDLADFEQGVKDGYITEDRLADIKDELARIEENKNRLAYILFLFELPNRTKKQAKYKKANKDVEQYFSQIKADETTVVKENESIISQIKQELKKLIEETKRAD